MKLITRIFGLAIVLVCMGSCEKYEIPIPNNFQRDIKPMIVEKCSGCHPVLLPPDFTEESVYTTLTQYKGGALLDFETPENSLVLEKATDGHSSNDISANQKQGIIEWIENGAKESEDE